MTDKIKSFLQWFSVFPLWKRIVLAVVAAIVALVFSSCGTTRAIVRNGTDSAVTSITITTNNPIDVTANPNVNITRNE